MVGGLHFKVVSFTLLSNKSFITLVVTLNLFQGLIRLFEKDAEINSV